MKEEFTVEESVKKEYVLYRVTEGSKEVIGVFLNKSVAEFHRDIRNGNIKDEELKF